MCLAGLRGHVRASRVLIGRARFRWARTLHRLGLGQLGYGVPVDQAIWDQQYRQGGWDFLYSPEERGHYQALVELIGAAAVRPRLLDVGCGHGRLAALLRGANFTSYLGIDLSPVAVTQARALGVAGARFVAADFERWRSDERFDAIVFNESLYYARRPIATARRFAGMLAPGGSLILSIANFEDNLSIFDRLAPDFATAEAREVENERRQRWAVRRLLPRART